MDFWIKQAFMDQHNDRMMQEAAKNRMLQQIRANKDNQSQKGESEVITMLKRRLAYTIPIVILIVLWLTQVAQAAAGGGGGGGYLVM